MERLRLRLRLAWRNTVQRRLLGVQWLERRLPWTLWRWLCGVNAETYVRALGERGRKPVHFFVQIGSNDGVQNDPLYETVTARGWSGLLVEPIPATYERLVMNYAGAERLRFANVAVGVEDGSASIFTIDLRPSDPPWAGQISSLDRSTLLQHSNVLPDLEDRIRTVPIETVRLETLLRRFGVGCIDLMHVDAEGFDDRVLEQIDSGAPWAPIFVLFEIKHLSAERYRRARDRMRRNRYRVVNLWPDAFAYRTRPW